MGCAGSKKEPEFDSIDKDKAASTEKPKEAAAATVPTPAPQPVETNSAPAAPATPAAPAKPATAVAPVDIKGTSEEVAAAQKMQAINRGAQARKDLAEQKAAAVKVQAIMRGQQQRAGGPGGKPLNPNVPHPGMKPQVGFHPGMKGSSSGYLPGYGDNALVVTKKEEDHNQAVKRRSKNRQSAAGADSVTFR